MIGLDAFLARETLVIGLVFCRVGAALMVLPAFGEPYVLSRARLGIALAIAILVGLPMSARLGLPPPDALNIAFLVLAEVLTGLLIGGIIRLVMFAVHFGGTLIAMQSGLATAAFFDPQERHNLADSPHHQHVLAELRDRLDRWMTASGDPLRHGPVALNAGGVTTAVDERYPPRTLS